MERALVIGMTHRATWHAGLASVSVSIAIYPLKRKVMQANVGNIDRAIRILAGLGLIAATLFGVIGAWGWIGVIPLATGMFRVCPAYLPFRIRTCQIKNKPHQ
jgi:hypothetical protein